MDEIGEKIMTHNHVLRKRRAAFHRFCAGFCGAGEEGLDDAPGTMQRVADLQLQVLWHGPSRAPNYLQRCDCISMPAREDGENG